MVTLKKSKSGKKYGIVTASLTSGLGVRVPEAELESCGGN